MVANVAGDLSYSMEDELCFFKIMRQFIDPVFVPYLIKGIYDIFHNNNSQNI